MFLNHIIKSGLEYAAGIEESYQFAGPFELSEPVERECSSHNCFPRILRFHYTTKLGRLPTERAFDAVDALLYGEVTGVLWAHCGVVPATVLVVAPPR